MKYSLAIHLELYSFVGEVFISLNKTTNEDSEMLIIKKQQFGIKEEFCADMQKELKKFREQCIWGNLRMKRNWRTENLLHCKQSRS